MSREVAAAGTNRAKRRPRLMISTDSPFSSHAETRRKLLRRSATVAVFVFMIDKSIIKHKAVKHSSARVKCPFGLRLRSGSLSRYSWIRVQSRLYGCSNPSQIQTGSAPDLTLDLAARCCFAATRCLASTTLSSRSHGRVAGGRSCAPRRRHPPAMRRLTRASRRQNRKVRPAP
jgi:hypothetical protein